MLGSRVSRPGWVSIGDEYATQPRCELSYRRLRQHVSDRVGECHFVKSSFFGRFKSGASVWGAVYRPAEAAPLGEFDPKPP
jgi:hypothetical protein